MADLITDKSFELNNTSEYNLSIQVSLDGFSFIITDSNNQNLIAFKNAPLKISSEKFLTRRIGEWIDSQNLLSNSYKQVKIIFHSSQFTVIPETFYSEERNPEIVKQLFDPVKNQNLKVNTVSEIQSKILFTVPIDFELEINKIFHNLFFTHPLELLFQNIPEDSFSGSTVLVLFNQNIFYTLIFREKKLVVANSYKYLHFNDILYFILANLQQNQIEPDEVKLFLTGSITPRNLADIETKIKKYLGSVEFFKPALNYDTKLFNNSDLLNSIFLIK